MTLTLRRMSTLAIMFATLAVGTLLLGNQRQAHADIPPDLANQIICRVFTDLNTIGPPLPVFPADCHNPPSATPQCSDRIDNDGDGLVDYPRDPGCTSAEDNTEAPNPSLSACSNNTDDDGDSFTDANDPNCHTDGNPTNTDSFNPNGTEGGTLPACWNNIDDDGDGLMDFPADPGCSSAIDTNEQNTPLPESVPENTLALCTDGIDNDADGKIDLADPDCANFVAKLVVVKIVINDNNGTSTVSDFSLHIATSSAGTAEAIGVSSGATTTVAAGTWTVGEIQKSGYTATFGGDCNSSGQVTFAAGETKTCTITNNDVVVSVNACADGIDNDGDGLIDSADPGCSGAGDNDETNVPTGGGGNIIPTGDSGSSGGGGGGGNGPIVASATSSSVKVKTATTTTESVLEVSTARQEFCDTYLTAFIKVGNKNDPVQVKRLQAVLHDFEGANIKVDGFYAGPTLSAVHTFQTKYTSEILAPWGIRKSTGFVYLTTRKKVNEIFCKNTKAFFLTGEQMKEIARVRSLAEGTSDVHLAAQQPPASGSASPNSKSPGEAGALVEKDTTTGTNRNSWRNFLNFVNKFF